MNNYRQAPLLFSKNDLNNYYYKVEAQALKEIRELNRKFFLETSEEDLVRHFEEKYRADPLKINFDDIERTDDIVGVDISQDFGRSIRDRSKPYYTPTPVVNFHIPFEGDSTMFEYAPFIDLNPPAGRVEGRFLIISIVAWDGNIKNVAPTFEREKGKIMNTVNALNLQIETLGNKYSQTVLQGIRVQKNIFANQQAEMDALPYPKKTDRIDVLPLQRRKLPISTLPTIGSSDEENSVLPSEEYDFILEKIFGMNRVMESAPDDFKTLSEPALRQHILVLLNALYEGQAKAEAFNGNGRTDILISYKSKNIFVGECKFFDGQQSVLDALGQLLGYTMWRDTKAALILFSRRKEFTDVLETVKATIPKHLNFLREISKAGDSETLFRYEFRQKHDPKRKMLLSVLVFNIPT